MDALEPVVKIINLSICKLSDFPIYFMILL